MEKELMLLDKSICLLSDFKAFQDEEFQNINWELLFYYGLKCKAICFLYNKLLISNCIDLVPSQYFKLMSEIYIGNICHNHKMNFEKQTITDQLSAIGIKVFDYKNVFLEKSFKDFLMPNDIDLIANIYNAQKINRILLSNGYYVKYVNGERFTKEELPKTYKSVLYEMKTVNNYEYPVKIDINFSFQHNCFLETILSDYISLKHSDDGIYFLLINLIEFFEHIKSDFNNISVENLLKIKRLNVQLKCLSCKQKELLFELADKYQVANEYSIMKDIVYNYKSII